MSKTPATSRAPYLLRAMHEWITDNDQTPHIVVDVSVAGVDVPRRYIQDGRIVLNISHSATSALALGNDWVRFRARFGGATHDVQVPIAAILGIYPRETGQMMVLTEVDRTPPEPPEPPGSQPAPPSGPVVKDKGHKRPALKVVK
jgi:stringent starvation protein B